MTPITHMKGKRPVLVGDDLELLTDYAQRQRVKTHIRFTRSGALVWPIAPGDGDT